jgi:hypothetical protein
MKFLKNPSNKSERVKLSLDGLRNLNVKFANRWRKAKNSHFYSFVEFFEIE